MVVKQRIRKASDPRESNKVKDMPFSVTDGEKAVFLESIPDPLVVLDTDLKVVWSNAAMNKLCNINADQLAGRHCFEKMHGLKKPCSVCPVVKTINTGQPCTVDDLSSLGKRWMMRAYPLLDDKGNITRVVEIATDITESKRAEDKLNNVRKLQSMILDNSTMGIAFVRNRIHEWVNPRLCEIYGIPKEQLEGSSTGIIFPDEESYQRQGEEIYSLFARGEKATLELYMRKRDGSLFWCRLEGMALDAAKPHEGSIWIVEDITKRKQAEEELQKLSKLQSVILDNSAVGIAFVRNRTYEWVNRKMSELFGIPVEQLQGSSTRIIYPNEEIFNRVGSEAYSLLAQGKNSTIETRMLKRDGSLFWCRLEGIVLDSSKPQDGSIWIFEDITEHKQAEETLRKSEEKYRGLIEGLNEALFRLSLTDGRFEYFSPSVTNVLGYSAEEIIAHPLLIRRAIHPDFQDFINEKFEELKKGKVSPTYEYKIIDSEGNERWILQSNNGRFDDNGKLIALEGICRDITKRKRAEAMLKENEEKYNQFFKTSRDFVFITSKDGRLVDINDAAVELLGYSSREELLQMKMPYVYDSEEERAKHIKAITECGFVKEFPVDLRRRDGIIRHTLLTAVTRCDAEGKTIGFQGTIRDITERRRIEEERERLILELQEAISQVKTLSGLLPICASCKKIRDDNGYWRQIESYIKDHSEAEFSHSICPDCVKKLYPELKKK